MYIAFGNRVVDSKDFIKVIEENTEFKVIKDMSKGSKREDIVALNLSIDISELNEVISENYPIPVLRVGVKDAFGESGKPEELLKAYGLTAQDIVNKVKEAIALKK